jgi:hypothetical protein
MAHRFPAGLSIVITCVVLLPGATAQTIDSSPVPRAAWGKPDLQGVWDFATLTPMERPDELAGQDTLTDEDVARIVARSAQATRFLSESRGDTGTYDEFWFDFGTDVSADRRSSLVVDPPSGKVPPLTEAAQRRLAARQAYLSEHPADSWEERNNSERCLMGFNAGPPMIPSAYNNVFQLFQTPDYVVILTEMVHDARVIPLRDSAHLAPHMRQWRGDSRGHWDGDTLVIETTNFTDKTSFRGSSERLRLTERFTRADVDILLYEFTVADPSAFTQPWTAIVQMRLSPSPLFEFACHEGNYAMEGMLAGARAEEAAMSR